jgi:heparan-alpha-glucosaminide N-acetyltransferase
MTAATAVSTTNTETSARAPRIASIDVFRGLTMILMIFVNDLASIKGLPWWNYHAPRNLDAMTYVDMVFPAFLFILGMTVPIALERRLRRGGSLWSLWPHIFFRTVALLVLGLILANAELGARSLMGIDSNVWAILALTGAVLFWNVYERSERYRTLFRVLRFSGLALMVAMFLIFRRITNDGHVGWIDPSYPEILGLLGWTYLAVSILYVATRRFRWAPAGWFVALMVLCVATTARWITFPATLHLYEWPFGNGAMASIAMAGIVTSAIFVGGRDASRLTVRQKVGWALALAAVSILAGWLLTPLGISKIRATPTWCLYCIGCSVLLFTLLYWICDVKRWNRWAAFTRPAGENTLLTYLLPDFYYFVIAATGSTYFATHASSGIAGVFRCVIFTGLILVLAGYLTRRRIRLQL